MLGGGKKEKLKIKPRKVEKGTQCKSSLITFSLWNILNYFITTSSSHSPTYHDL